MLKIYTKVFSRPLLIESSGVNVQRESNNPKHHQSKKAEDYN